MARTMSVPCRRDLACYRDDGHPGDCAYPTPETVPQPATLPSLDVAARAFAKHVSAIACDHAGSGAGTHTGCPERLALDAALSREEPTP